MKIKIPNSIGSRLATLQPAFSAKLRACAERTASAKLLATLLVASTLVATPALASPLVTPNVPLDSPYYMYLDKMEAMGYLTGMPGGTKPYSRYKVAKLLATVIPLGMQTYMKAYYDAMCDEFSDEIAYIIVHEPLNNQIEVNQKTVSSPPKDTTHPIDGRFKQYVAQNFNLLVAAKVRVAQQMASASFPSNVALRSAKLELSHQSMDQLQYAYRRTNASYQPLHSGNRAQGAGNGYGASNGNRYGRGANAVGQFTLSGSITKDMALSATPRVSWDKDNHGKVSLTEGYLRTHVGLWGITAGRQALNWSSHFGSMGPSISANAKAQTMVNIGLLEPFQFEKTWLRKLGKIDLQLFASRLEHNRKTKFGQWQNIADPEKFKREYDHGTLWGARLEFTPNDTFTLGFERISMMKKFGRNYFFIRNDGIDGESDYGNDQNGIDFRWKLPGVQFYGGIYGEDGTTDIGTLFMSNKFVRSGVYFPQLAKDGSWDLRLQFDKNSRAWYTHGAPFANGWSYHDDVMGDPMGNQSRRYTVAVNNYLANGDTLGFNYMYSKWDYRNDITPHFKEYQINYSHRLKRQLHLDAALGLAHINNADYKRNRTDTAKYVALGLRWEY